ncbi:hypothetical protein [Microbacterium sp. K24]|uniref:hypothetical protein n=1 Tax=Microbacterium sp. K24 TaxID=2305446 RepID=UPI00109CFBE9|nr:hypothetical protein [Microbacterium sp. K24]
MVDMQRLELEKKRYKRESVSLAVAVLALAVSIAATGVAVWPVLHESGERADTTVDYLSALSRAGVNDALGAMAYAESGSPAAEFATTVSRWRQAQRQDSSQGDIKDGTVARGDDGAFSLCLPELSVPLFPEECVTIDNVDYSTQGEVLNFTIDGVPTGSLVRSVTDADLADGGVGPMRVYPVTGVVSPDGSRVTLVYDLQRRREADRRYPVTFSSVIIQDDREEELEISAQYFPSEVGYWEKSSAVIQVPRETAFFFICWDGVLDQRGECDWTYGTGMR